MRRWLEGMFYVGEVKGFVHRVWFIVLQDGSMLWKTSSRFKNLQTLRVP